MIGIKLDDRDEFLRTEIGTSLSLKLENPLFFTPDKISPGSYSWPFDIPLNPNRALLGHPQVAENNQAYAAQRASIYAKGTFLKSGKIHIKETKQKTAAYFTFGLNSIGESFKTQKLREVAELFDIIYLNTDSIVKKVHTDATMVNIVANGIGALQPGRYYQYPSGGIGAPDIKSYPAGPTPDYVPFLKQVSTNSPDDRIVGTHWEVYMVKFEMVPTGLGGFELGPVPCTDPNVELNVEVVNQAPGTYILQPDVGSYYSGFATFLDPFLDGTLPTTGMEQYLRFPFMASSALESKAIPYINHSNGAGTIVPNDPEGSYDLDIALPSNVNSLQPFLTLRYPLDRIAAVYGFEYEGDFWESGLPDELLLWNTTVLDLPQKYINNREFVFWRRYFQMRELLPDISVVEFFQYLQQSFNLAVYYNELTKKVRLQFRESVANNATYQDVTERSSPVTVTAPVSFQANTKVISAIPYTEISYSIDPDNVITILDFAHKKGDAFTMQLLHWDGFDLVDGYTYAKVSGYTLPGSPIWNFMQNRMKSIETKIKFTMAEILQLDWELKRRFDRVDYLIKTIDLKISERGFEVTNVELYSLR